jgi:hypothetical protein
MAGRVQDATALSAYVAPVEDLVEACVERDGVARGHEHRQRENAAIARNAPRRIGGSHDHDAK